MSKIDLIEGLFYNVRRTLPTVVCISLPHMPTSDTDIMRQGLAVHESWGPAEIGMVSWMISDDSRCCANGIPCFRCFEYNHRTKSYIAEFYGYYSSKTGTWTIYAR